MKHELTKGPVMKTMLLFAIPMILGDLLQQCYNIADTLIVGRFLGADALAAVGSAFALMTFLTSILLGLAMGSGTDIAMESGDVVLVGGGISSLSAAVRLSRATMRKIKQNLFWAFFYNIIGIPVAAFGLLSPIIAGAAMALSSVTVVTNSMLLKRSRL